MSNVLDKAALGAIRCYKRYLSPLKGYKCAYGSVYGTSCSTMAEELVAKHGVIDAQPLIKEQFKKCRATYQELKDSGEVVDKPEENRSRSTDNGCHGCHDPLPCWLPFSGGGRGRNNQACDVDGCDIDVCG